MACGGALAVINLIKRGILNINDIPSGEKDPALWNDDDIKTTVCAGCDFKTDDCDFESDNPPTNCEPCGGFILLSILRRKGLIDADIIREISL